MIPHIAPLPPLPIVFRHSKTPSARTSLIARNYREAVRQYMTEIDDLVRTTAIDYHRVKLHEKYDDVLAMFLLARVQKKGGR